MSIWGFPIQDRIAMSKEVFALYSRECLSCGHLVSGLPERAKPCHYDKGNTDCPASEVVITMTKRLKVMVTNLKKARREHDAAAEAAILAKVAKETQANQQTFYRLLATKSNKV